MKPSALRLPLLLVVFASACASPAEPEKLDASLQGHVLDGVPADVPERTLVDFGESVELVGWDLDLGAKAAPGSRIPVKFYWRSVKKLSAGWSLFTHLVAAGDDKPYAFDDVGPLRASVPDAVFGQKQKLSPSDWVPGKIYEDEQDLAIPGDVTAPELTLLVGLSRQAVQVAGREVAGLSGLRLPILSGLSDGQNRAIVARLATGVTSGEKKPDQRSRKRPAGDRPPAKQRGPRAPLPLARPGRQLAQPSLQDPKETQ